MKIVDTTEVRAIYRNSRDEGNILALCDEVDRLRVGSLMTMRLPLETLQVIVEEVQNLQGAANGFGELVSCVIRVAPEREGEPPIMLTYANREWFAQFGDNPVTTPREESQ